jgi:hypothetical protein
MSRPSAVHAVPPGKDAEPEHCVPPHSEPSEAPRKVVRGLDPEVQAMAALDRIVAKLPDACVQRVLAWLTDRHWNRGPGECPWPQAPQAG